MRSLLCVLAICCATAAGILAITARAHADPTGITGTITTMYGAKVRDVTVTADPGSRSAVTDQTGAYTIADLSPGEYSVTASLAGTIHPQTREGVVVQANLLTQCDFVVTESVTGWPLTAPGSGGGANQVQEVWGGWGYGCEKLGETAADGKMWKVHDGVDLCGDDFPNVYAVKGGTIDAIVRSGYTSNFRVNRGMEGGEWYYHVVADSNLHDKHVVSPGQKLGTVWTGSPDPSDHIHFSVQRHYYGAGGDVNPLAILDDPLPTYTGPAISDVCLVRDPDQPVTHYSRRSIWPDWQLPKVGSTLMARDRVDIVVEATSRIESSIPVGVYRMDYAIEGDEDATSWRDRFERIFLALNGASSGISYWGLGWNKDTNWANLIYGGRTDYKGAHYYVPTNSSGPAANDFANVTEGCWDTTGSPDGKYKLTVGVYDYRKALNASQSPVEQEVSVVVDNTPVVAEDPCNK